MLYNFYDLKTFYQNKNILITGHTGFKGSWLSLFLNQLNANSFGISLERKKIYEKSGFDHNLVSDEIITDINDVEK